MVDRLNILENYVGMRQYLKLNAFIKFEPVKRF
jgi:hypothetical protein